MEKPLISVIVPVYKVEKYLRNCVNSIINQSYSNWELILVNDGSPDACPQICDEYAAADTRIKVLHKENGGLSDARNVGLDNIQGEYVSFLDSDDHWHSNYLQILIKACLDNNCQIAQCGFLQGTDTTFPSEDSETRIQLYDNHSIFLSNAAQIIMCSKLYKSSLFTNIRMPVGKINEDDYTTWKLYYAASKIAVVNRRLYYYTANTASIYHTTRRNPSFLFLEAYDERISFFQATGERDLEDFTRGHVCRAMVIAKGNPNITEEQKNLVMKKFAENWSLIKNSPFIPRLWRLVFYAFNILPVMTSKLVNYYKN